MKLREDLTGKRYGKLYVSKYMKNGRWLCVCDCGEERINTTNSLEKGLVKSCGCGKKKFKPNVRYNHLVTISQRFDSDKKVSFWLCKCDCGSVKEYCQSNIIKGTTRSCGCMREEAIKAHNKSYGKSKERLYDIWCGMRNRCNNPNNHSYKNYGGRGITYYKRWNDYEIFKKWAIKSGYDDNLTLERKDVNKNYTPQNCCWITMTEQQYNKRTTSYIEYNGIKKSIAEWSKETGIKQGTLSYRRRNGWTASQILGYEKKRITRY